MELEPLESNSLLFVAMETLRYGVFLNLLLIVSVSQWFA
jgi:hypothetical protein